MKNFILTIKSSSFILLLLTIGLTSTSNAQVKILDNGYLRMGNGGENSVNTSGTLQQPFYYNGTLSVWRKLTYSTYPLDYVLAVGGDKTNQWNVNGTVALNPALTGQVIDYSNYIPTSATQGYGVIKSTGNVNIGGKLMRVEQIYTLPQASGYIEIKVKITNIDATLAENVRIWVGTRDDWVGDSDVPRKQRGNLVSGSFVQNTSSSQQALALKISTSTEAVLVYTNSTRGYTVVNSCCSFTNSVNQNPATSSNDVTSDGSYAFYVRMNDLAPNQSDEFTWYYAAGSLANIEEIINEVAQASGSVQNITCSSATYNATATANGTGYWMAVPQGSVAPTAAQIKAGTNYGAVNVISHGSGVMTANVQSAFSVSGLSPASNYTLYFVHEDAVPQFSAIINSAFSTPPLPSVSITANGPIPVCPSGSVTLTATAGSSYTWSNGATTQAINVTVPGNYSVTMTNAAACTNTSAPFAVTFQDNTPPIAIAQNTTLTLDASGNATASVASVNNGSSDNCGIATMTLSKTTFNCTNIGANTVTLTVTDVNGNISTATATVTVNGGVDTDGDGIANGCDSDDDNDGITDIAECNTSNFYWSSAPTVTGTNTASGTINGITYIYSSTATIETTPSVYNHTAFPSTYVVPNANPTIKNTQITTNTLTFASPMTNPVLVFASIGNSGTPVSITFNNPVDIVWSQDVTKDNNQQVTGREGYAIIRMNGVFSSISFDYLMAENWCNFAFGADFQSCPDTDGDGTPDFADTDSDNDGCSDALEGAASLNPTQIVNNRLTGSVAANGIPVIAGTGQGIGTSKTAAANCSCQAGNDWTPPVVRAKNNIFINLGTTGSTTINAAQIDSASTDACGIQSRSVSPSSFDCSNVGPVTLTLTVTDINGNVSTGTASAFVIDNIAPTVIVQPVTVYLNASGTASVTAAQVNNGSSDACGIATMSLDKTTFSCSNAATSNSGVLTVKTTVDNQYWAYISTDDNVQGTFVGSGNNWPTLTTYTANLVAGQTYYLHVYAEDIGGPEMMIGDFAVTGDFKFINGAQTMSTTAANWKVSSTGWNNYVPALDVGPNGTSPWGNYPGVSSSARFIWRSPWNTTGNDVAYFTTPIYYTGNNAVLFTATDTKGNAASAFANITVRDTIAPVMTCPANISVYASSASGTVVSYGMPSATDNCSSATVTRISGFASGATFPIGTTTVTHRATDPSGNSTVCSFTVTVSGLAPVIAGPGTISVNATAGQCNAPVTYTATETTGIPASTITYSIPSGAIFNVGTTAVTATATNAVGTSSVTFNVIVVDNQLPAITAPADITMNIPSCQTTGAVVSLGNASASDNCSVTVTNNAPTSFGVGTTTVTWTAQDPAGNTTTASQTVTITQSAPLVVNADRDINCSGPNSGSITVNATGGRGPLQYQLNTGAFQNGNVFSNLSPGVYTVTVTDADNCSAVLNQITLTEPFCLQAVNDQFDNCAGNPITIQKSTLLGNDANPWNVAVYMDVQQPANGTIVDNGTSITYTPNPGFSGVDQFNYTIKKNDGTIAFAGNGHVYEWVPFYGVTWNTARAAAALRYYNGMQGYLVTVTSQAEMNFVSGKLQGAGWMGASDRAYEGVWRWVTGPEGLEDFGQGRHFSDQFKSPFGNCSAGTATGLMGQYANWAGGEPNDCGAYLNQFSSTDINRGGEHYAHFYGQGIWNDYPDNVGGSIQGYIVEYGGMEGPIGSAGTSTASITIDTRKVVISESVVHATCETANDGNISLNVSGGTEPYVYNWGGGITSKDRTGLTAGSYTVTVTDAKGCSAIKTITINVVDDQLPVALSQDITVTLNASGMVSITAAQVNNGSSDNCGILSMSVSPSSFNCSNTGANTVTLSVTDIHQNTSTTTAIVSVEDITPPVIVCQSDISMIATSAAGVPVYYTAPSASDNCSATVSMTAGLASGSVFPIGITTVTYVAVDPSGNSVNCSFNVTVEGVPPVIVSPGNQTVVNATGQCSATVFYAATETAGIPASTITYSHAPGSIFPVGTTTVTATATNPIGTSSVSFDVTVNDLEVPVAITQNVTIQLNASGQASITTGQINNGSSDNCAIASYSLSKTDFDCGNVGLNNVTLSVTDVHGNVSTAAAVVTVVDGVAPVAIAQNVSVELDASGNGSTTAVAVNNGSSDACGIASLVLSKTNFDCSNVGANNVTLTVTDVNGNVSTATAVVTVVDGIAPVANAQNVTVQLDASGNGSILAAAVNNGSTDACGIASLVLSKTNFDCSNVGPNNVTLTVTDANGNVSTAPAVVTVVDGITPVVVTQNITIGLDSAGQASIAAIQINDGSTDNCGIASYALSQTTFTCANLGNNTVTLTVTDVNGNSASAPATVTILDQIAPTVLVKTVNAYLDAAGSVSILTADVNNGSFDNCSVNAMALSKAQFNCSNIGANVVMLTVTDGSGNSSAAAATINVLDTIKPIIGTQNITVQLNASGTASITASQINNGSTDNCAIATYAVSPTTFTCANVGANTVVLTVTDVNGNISAKTATVTILDTIKPTVLTKNISVTLSNGMASISGSDVDSASYDNCSIASMVVSPNTFNCSNIGNNTVTLTVTDVNGNVSSKTTVVKVIGAIPTASITQGVQPGFSQGAAVVLTANSPTGIAYNWTGGPAATEYYVYASGTYTVTVTNQYGCTVNASTVVTYTASSLLSAYTIIGRDKVELEDHVTVYNGGVGVTSSCGDADIEDNSTVTASGTFVRAKDIDVRHSSTVTTKIFTATPTSILPAFLSNPYCNGNSNSCSHSHHNSCSGNNNNGCGSGNCHHSHHNSCSNNISNNKNVGQNATVIITDSIMGTVVIGKNANVTFTSANIYIKDLEIREGADVQFTKCAVIRVCNHVKMDKNVSFNAANMAIVTMYIEKKLDLDQGVNMVAHAYAKDKVTIDGKSNNLTTVTGMIIGESVKAEEYVSFYWNTATVCPAGYTKTELVAQEDGLLDTYFEADVYPNPAISSFNIRLFSSSSAPFTIEVYDMNGRLVETNTSENPSLQHTMGEQYADGFYFVKITQENNTKTIKLVKANR